jgi:hypothetical protein
MVIRPKHVAVIEYNIQNSVALDENPEPDPKRCLNKNETLKVKKLTIK